jgi:DNA-directed RNA polymerase subunit RPC12/RpoP
MYGIAHCLIDRDGRVIGCNLPIGNGPLLEQAPAMAQILRELAAGVPAAQLFNRAAQVLDRIDTGRDREPGEDDE